VLITYEFLKEGTKVEAAVEEFYNDIKTDLTKPFIKWDKNYKWIPVGEKKGEVEGAEFVIRIFFDQIVPVVEKIREKVKNEERLDSVLKVLASYDSSNKEIKQKQILK